MTAQHGLAPFFPTVPGVDCQIHLRADRLPHPTAMDYRIHRTPADLGARRTRLWAIRLPLLDELRHYGARVAIGVDHSPGRGVGATPETADLHAFRGDVPGREYGLAGARDPQRDPS